MDRSVNYLGIARKAGCLEIGEESAGLSVRHGTAKLLVLAADASDNARRRAEGYVFGTAVPLVTAVQTKQELSRLWSKPGCSMAAITDIGIAAGYAAALAETQPEQYADAAAQLAEKNRRAAQRRTEKRAADHNKRVGKRRNNT